METTVNTFSSIDRYADGIGSDYSMQIKMWSAFDRSLMAFNRRCGIITSRDKDSVTQPPKRCNEDSK